MNNIINDVAYINLVSDILDNEEFIKMKKYDHHGITRYDHLLKISYHSYLLAKKQKLNVRTVARAALLHDFFDIDDQFEGFKRGLVLNFTHPKYALEKASSVFNLSDNEKNIIRAHMFPFIPSVLPKHKEAWLVDFVDKWIGTRECLVKYRSSISYAINAYLLFFVNSLFR
jgi:uncharacterized protein